MPNASTTMAANREGSAEALPDMEKFRLRRFVDTLVALGEVEVHNEHVDLAEIGAIVEATPKTVLFRSAGPEGVELVANVMGSRRRLAAALGVAEPHAVAEFERRIRSAGDVVEVPSAQAPVHQVVLAGDQADFTRLPFHPQHEFDGSVYLSSAIDYAVDPATGLTNLGCRRLSLRNRKECGTNVTVRSHLMTIYRACVARGEKLPVSFVVGSHPLDFLAAVMRMPGDEVRLIGALRGEPVPLVKCVTNDNRVPADAEVVLEGYLDERGYVEPEGPFGEYMGYYGPMRLDPVFQLTAVTMRRDALHQSLLHGSGRILGRTEAANLTGIRLEADAKRILTSAGIDVVDVHLMLYGGEGQHLRVAIRQKGAGEARRVIAAVLGTLPSVKHVFVVDEDIDIRSEEAMQWALGTRFQADRDFVLYEGIPGMRMDPSLDGRATGAKAGFDLTRSFGRDWSVGTCIVEAKRFGAPARCRTVAQALEAGPLFFTHIMEAVGSRDGREVACALDELRQAGRLGCDADGRYRLAEGEKGRTVFSAARR